MSGVSSAGARQIRNSAGRTCLAAFPVRWAAERYYALGHLVPSGVSLFLVGTEELAGRP
jgi:hypothetical protein